MSNFQNADNKKSDNTPESIKAKTGRSRADTNKNISSKYNLSKQSKINIKKQIERLKLKKKKQKEINRQKDVKLKEENLQNTLNNININGQTKINKDIRESNQKSDKLILEHASNLDNTKSENHIIKINHKSKTEIKK